jgi:hypothetical protein
MRRKTITIVALALTSVCITLCTGEFLLRKMIFSQSTVFNFLKEPKLYADQEWDENYWKLARMWGKTKAPTYDSLLGWQFKLIPKTFMHHDIEHLNGKRPVLLYGDSFANCIDSTICFEEYLNSDSDFSKSNYLINYGTGGYGVDQIYNMMINSYKLYKNPLVIFSFLTFDLDRSGLKLREGLKPYYTLDVEGELQLNFLNHKSDPDEFINQNPPEINSYLWKLFLYSKLNFIPERIKRSLKGEMKARIFIKKLDKKLIHESVKELRENHIDFIFIIFEGYTDFKISEEKNWRIKFVKKVLKDENVTSIFAKDLIKDEVDPKLKNLSKFLIPNDSHPTSYFNKIVANEIKRQVALQEKVVVQH